MTVIVIDGITPFLYWPPQIVHPPSHAGLGGDVSLWVPRPLPARSVNM